MAHSTKTEDKNQKKRRIASVIAKMIIEDKAARSIAKRRKKQNTNGYDKARKAADPWFRAQKNARSMLSQHIRSLTKLVEAKLLTHTEITEIGNAKLRNRVETKVDSLIGIPVQFLYLRFNQESIVLTGKPLNKTYGKVLEIEHIKPLGSTDFRSIASKDSVTALRAAFNPANLTVTFKSKNRAHKKAEEAAFQKAKRNLWVKRVSKSSKKVQ